MGLYSSLAKGEGNGTFKKGEEDRIANLSLGGRKEGGEEKARISFLLLLQGEKSGEEFP